ncbi:arginine biosynthesis protein ArgJ, partial [Ochromonadaceae sp. CCMP2298]
GDQSTSDTVLLISSQKVPCSSQAQAQEAEFESALSGVTLALAADMVRNGEGTQHVMRVSVTGTTDALALGIGRAVVNSNLVKCAVSGNDPNVGRIAGAVGSYLGNLGTEGMGLAEGLEIWLGGIQILANRSFKLDGETEVQLSDYMLEAQLFPASVPESDRNYPPHERYVEIEVRVGGARGEAFVVLGSDLTKEYVEVNADYRS